MQRPHAFRRRTAAACAAPWRAHRDEPDGFPGAARVVRAGAKRAGRVATARRDPRYTPKSW
ncbi:MAG: hypothetical protein D6689_11925 [Deltaproteobacteria bacterium]|nr:MAG: hypothetical protein D6689_11925 [Deltaproteobacteria bacterium]